MMPACKVVCKIDYGRKTQQKTMHSFEYAFSDWKGAERERERSTQSVPNAYTSTDLIATLNYV